MALSSSCIFELRPGSGSSTAGGGFDPSQTAGMLTDGAATSATGTAPVFSSASYNFVAGDVGAFVYIASGTNWTPGWYEISSVAANAATLDATTGHATLANGALTSADGCATTGSPTGATWSIDYSQQNAAQIAFTDLVIGATTTQLTSVAHPFGQQMVGNILDVTSGTGFTTGRYSIASVSTVTATMDRSVGTAASTGGHANLGGALNSWADPLLTGASGTPLLQGGQRLWVTGTQTVSTNIVVFNVGTPGGNGGRTVIQGYGTYRGDATHSSLKISVNNLPPLLFQGAAEIEICQIDVSSTAGSPVSPCGGFYFNSSSSSNITLRRCKASAVNIGVDGISSVACNNLYLIECDFSSCSSHGVCNLGTTFAFGCRSHGNTGAGFRLSNNAGAMLLCLGCVADGNTGAGFDDASSGSLRFVEFVNCVAYNNTSDGFKLASGSGIQQGFLINNIAYGNGGYGFNFPSLSTTLLSPLSVGIQMNNAFGSNTSGARSSSASALPGAGDVTLTGDPFTAGGSGDFTLNSTSGAGAACRQAGWQSSIL